MIIINLEDNQIIGPKKSEVKILMYKNVNLNLSDDNKSMYLILRNCALSVGEKKYFCEKILINFIDNNKNVYLQGAQKIDMVNPEKYLYSKKELKKMTKEIGTLKAKISKGKNSVDDFYKVNLSMKKYLISKLVEDYGNV